MGTWGMRVYEDDTALDVRSDFLEKLGSGMQVPEIEKIVREEFDEDDYDENNDVVSLALCCVELETGTLTDETKAKALEIIESGRQYEHWLMESSPEDAGLRKRELTLIKKYIQTYDGKPVKRKSWVELQKVDREFTEEHAEDISEKLDDTGWHIGSVAKDIPEDQVHHYAGAHIAACLYWIATRDALASPITHAKETSSSFKKLSDFLETQMDGKLFTDTAKKPYQAFLLYYYFTDASYYEDYAEIVGKGRAEYTFLPTKEELDMLASKIDERYKEFQKNPVLPKPKKGSFLDEWSGLLTWVWLLLMLGVLIFWVIK